jgi:hypothetical protein
MKVDISGIARFVVRRDGKVIKDVSTPNSLTVRGALELMTRHCTVTSITEAEGQQVEDFINIFSTTFVIIPEAGYTAVDRLDRIQYYDLFNVGVPALGDNRQWSHIESEGVTWQADGDPAYDDLFTWDTGNLPFDFDTKQATVKHTFRPGATQWRGLAILNLRTGGTGQSIQAVLASAVLPAPLDIGQNDFVDVSWTLKLTPTFA